MNRVVLALALASAVTVGCSKQNAEVSEKPGAGTATPVKLPKIRDTGAKSEADTAQTAPGGGDGSFKLAVSTPAAGPAGTEAIAHVTVTPSTGWHMNKDYPTKLKLTAPEGVALQKAVLELADVAKLDDNELAFDVKLTPARAGTYKVDGELKFAVCTPDTCDPKKQTIAFDVVAQ